jgi:hypothetical protein
MSDQTINVAGIDSVKPSVRFPLECVHTSRYTTFEHCAFRSFGQ